MHNFLRIAVAGFFPLRSGFSGMRKGRKEKGSEKGERKEKGRKEKGSGIFFTAESLSLREEHKKRPDHFFPIVRQTSLCGPILSQVADPSEHIQRLKLNKLCIRSVVQ